MASQIKGPTTPAEELRQILGQLEARIGRLGYADDSNSLEILTLLDRANQLIQRLTDHNVDLAAERSRFHTLTLQLRHKSHQFLKQAGGSARLEQARKDKDPPSQHWWWFIDQMLAGERQRRLRRTLQMLAVAAIALLVIAGLYSVFLQPDETTRLRYRYQQQAERALNEGDIEAALEATEQALACAPSNADLLVLQGVALTLIGRRAEADIVFSEAATAFDDNESFLSNRAQAYMMAGRPDLALEDTARMLDLDANSALAYLQMGNANTALGNLFAASQNYEQAAELAAAANQTELEGMARVQLANLTIIMMAPQSPAPVAEPQNAPTTGPED